MGNGNGGTGIRPTTDTIDIENESVIPIAGARRLQVTGTAADGTTLTSRVRTWALLSHCFYMLVCAERGHLIRDLHKATAIQTHALVTGATDVLVCHLCYSLFSLVLCRLQRGSGSYLSGDQ